MAAGERSGGSDRRFAQRRSPLLLLLPLLLLPVRPGEAPRRRSREPRVGGRRPRSLLTAALSSAALGNEGAASGSCQCEKFSTEPALVRRFPDRLVGWERCRGLIR